MFIDDSACNLASINLMKFRREDGTLRRRAVPGRRAGSSSRRRRSWSTTRATRPTGSRPTATSSARSGLGYANLGSLIMASGLPYDSDEGRALAGGDHGDHARPGVPDQRRARRRTSGPFDGFALNREPMLRVMEMHRDAVESIDASAPADLLDEARAVWAECLEIGPQARLPQQPGDRAGPDRHDRLHDGLRHDRDRARHRAGEVQEPRRRRDAQDRQPDRADGAAQARLRRAGDPRHPRLHRRPRHDRGGAGPEGRAPAGLRLRVRPAAGGPEHPLPGPPADDGGGPAVPLGGDLQDRATCRTRRPSPTSARPTSKAGGSASRPWRSTATAPRGASR